MAYTITLSGGVTRKTQNLRNWLTRNYGKRAYFISFNSFDGVILGSILSRVDQSSSSVEDTVFSVSLDGRELGLNEVRELTDEVYAAESTALRTARKIGKCW